MQTKSKKINIPLVTSLHVFGLNDIQKNENPRNRIMVIKIDNDAINLIFLMMFILSYLNVLVLIRSSRSRIWLSL